MNKPDWSDAPEWANYLAMDSDGEWYWYENKPFSYNRETWGVKHGKVGKALEIWKESLEPRPE